MGLKIERIDTRLVVMPLAEPIKHPFMGERTQFATLIVQVHCSDGCSGLGYASVESLRLAQGLRSMVAGLSDYLVGQDPLMRSFLHDRMWNLTVDVLHDGASNLVLAAIDMALWDICGKQGKVPLWKLLGGFRQRVPAYASWTLWRHQDNDRLQADAAKLVAQGWRAMKLRLGGGRTLAQDAERARLVREAAGPDVQLMVDALWGLTATEGIRMADMLGELNYAWLEEPVREGDFAGIAHVKARRALPIAGGERISRLQMVDQLVASVDHAILDVSHLGGITQWMKAAAIVETANLPISTHSYCVVSAHLLAATRNAAWLESMDWWDPLFIGVPRIENGAAVLSERPGLGMELNEETVRRYEVD